MRPIKFRGRYLSGEATVYGDLIHTKHGVFIATAPGGCIEVDPDTVAQLVGYDKNGKEIYEGDTVAFFYEGDTLKGTRSEWTAVLMPDIVKNEIQDARSVAFNRLTLKENNQ